MEKILVVRTDKIGDVTLTTPAVSALRQRFPKAEILGFVSVVASDVYRLNPHLSGFEVFDHEKYGGFFGFWRLVKWMRSHAFGAVVVFQSGFKVSLAAFTAGIPIRIGPFSKWWSFLLYNRGRRQNRSAVEMHEADYNIQLLKDFGISVAATREKTYLLVDDESRRNAMRFFVEKGLSRKFKTVAIHPGMAGSALNWPENHYIALARRLMRRYNIIITGGPAEAALLERVSQGIARVQSYAPDQPVFTRYLGEKGLAEMIAILDHCDAVVAPSTGPLHLANALGKKVVSVFSPIKVQSALRWGPYGVSMGTNLGVSPHDTASVLVPDVTCGEDFKCALSACIYYPCMPRVSVDDVETQLVALLEGGAVTMFKSTAMQGISQEWEDLEDLE